MFQDDDDYDVDVGINDRTGKMDIKPTIWQDIAIDNHQNKDFARYLLNYILMNHKQVQFASYNNSVFFWINWQNGSE